MCFFQFLSSMRRRLDDPELCSSDVIFNMMLMYREIQVSRVWDFLTGKCVRDVTQMRQVCVSDW